MVSQYNILAFQNLGVACNDIIAVPFSSWNSFVGHFCACTSIYLMYVCPTHANKATIHQGSLEGQVVMLGKVVLVVVDCYVRMTT